MIKRKPLILITNDDGYQANGIKALIESVKELGEIVIVAPDGPRSGMSNAITSLHPIRINLLNQNNDFTLYSCTGTPVDCVKIGITEVLGRQPDLVVSGINHGSNASISVLYSGTMGAAMEGCIFKVPSIGFSLLDHSFDADFSYGQKYINALSKHVLNDGLPIGTCLNVNIPTGNNLKGMKICKQTAGKWVEEYAKAKDGSGKEVYWLTGRFQNDEPNNTDSDEWALANGYVTVVPTRIDMTNHEFISDIKGWEKLI